MTDPEDRRRRSFGPVVLLGLGSAALLAVSAAKTWYAVPRTGAADASLGGVVTGGGYPAASAVSLALLATWGVLLVTRGRVRRAFAALALGFAVLTLVTVVVAHQTLPGDHVARLGVLTGRPGGTPRFTGWFWTSAVCAVLALLPAGLAVRLSPAWPEMGSRYDAPSAAASAPEQSLDTDRDLWRALDEGRDPTQS